MSNNNVLNQFNGDKIEYSKLKEILDSLDEKAVNVEIVKGVCTAQYYDCFQWNEYKEILSLEDESMEIPPVYFRICDIKEIINGREMYLEHLLVRLKNEVEIMLWLNP